MCFNKHILFFIHLYSEVNIAFLYNTLKIKLLHIIPILIFKKVRKNTKVNLFIRGKRQYYDSNRL